MLLSRAVTGLRWVKSIPNGSASIPTMSSVVHRHQPTASVSARYCRPLCTKSFNSNRGSSPGNDGSGGGGGGGNDGFDANAMFSNENVRNLSPAEVARLNITYGLIQDHIDAIRRGYAQVDPASNPLIDPRSFQLKRLPRVPDDVLKHFRREIPASVATNTRPVVTRDIWDNNNSNNNNLSPSASSTATGGRSPKRGWGLVPGYGLELMSESLGPMQDWDRIDERTMTTHSLSRRLRTSTTSMTAALTTNSKTNRKQLQQGQQHGSFVTTAARLKKRKPIVLRDSSGRVEVDFRCVATLNMFLTEGGKIMPRRKTGLSARSQKKVSKAIKRARCMALINPVPKGPTMAELVAMHDEDEFGTGEELMEMIRKRDEAAAGSSSSGGKKKKK